MSVPISCYPPYPTKINFSEEKWSKNDKFKSMTDTDSVMMALATTNIDLIVKEERRASWPHVKSLWFSTHAKCKTPGLMKIEKSTESGSFIALSPKCYLLGKLLFFYYCFKLFLTLYFR